MVDLAGAVRLAGIPQGSLEWLSEWDLRITGSKCYSLYTYAKGVNPDWQRKMASLDKARGFVGSVATKYGQKHRTGRDPAGAISRPTEARCHASGGKVVQKSG